MPELRIKSLRPIIPLPRGEMSDAARGHLLLIRVRKALETNFSTDEIKSVMDNLVKSRDYDELIQRVMVIAEIK